MNLITVATLASLLHLPVVAMTNDKERRYVLLTDNAEHEARDVSTPVVATDLTKQMTEEEHINACERDYAVSHFINDVSSSLCPSLTVEYTQMFNCLFTVVRRMCMIF